MGCAPSVDEKGRRHRRNTEYTDYGSDEELNPETREHTRTSLGDHIVNKARYHGDDRYPSNNQQKGRFYNAVKRVQNRPKSPKKCKPDTNELGMKRLPTRLEIMIEQMRGHRPKKRKVNLHTKTYDRVKEMDKQAKEEAQMKLFSRQSRIVESRGGSVSLPSNHLQTSPLPDIVEEEYWSHHGSVTGSPSPRISPRYYDNQMHRSVTVYETGGKVSRGTDYYNPSPTHSPMPSPRTSPSRNISSQTEPYVYEDGSHYSPNRDTETVIPLSPKRTKKQEPWAQKRQPVTGKPEKELEKERLKMEIYQTAAAGHLQRQKELKRINDQINDSDNMNTESNNDSVQKSKSKQDIPPRFATPMIPYSRKSPRTGNTTPRGGDVTSASSPAPPRGSKTYQELSHGARNNMDDAFIGNVSVNTIPKSAIRIGTASTA